AVEPDSVTITADVSRIKTVGDYEMVYTVEFPATVADEDISVTDRTPSHVNFTVEKQVSKVLEVRGILDGEIAEGYMAEAMTFDHEEITIEGPEAVVNTVSYAQVVLPRTNLDKSVTTMLPYTLMDAEGNVVNDSEIFADVVEIEVTQTVSKIKDIPLVMEFIAGGGATEKNVTTTIEPSTITVSGDATTVDSMNQIVLDNIDLSDVNGNIVMEFPITIPNDVKNISGEETAMVTLKIHGLGTSTISVSAIDFINVPPDYTASSITMELQINIRAATEDIGSIAEKNLRVVGDLSQWSTEGIYTVPVTVFVDGFDSAGVMGDYSVVVALEREVDEIIETVTSEEE
ncbi:MAG: CdaR family protein, partial [Eubacteriales bacterium]